MKKSLLVLSAAAMVAAAAVPAMAETTLYGSARMATFYNINDTKAAAGKTSSFDEHLQTNSRVGLIASNGDVGGRVELGTGVNVRLLYGTWNFGAGKLTVGQDYNSYYLLSEQVHGDDNVNNGYGALWDGRQAQLRVNLNNGLYFAAIQATQTANGTPDQKGGAIPNGELTNGKKIYLPKLNVGYAGKAGAVAYNAGVVGEFYKDENAGINKNVTAILGYVNGTAAFGATTLKANLSYGQNAGDMNFAGREGYGKNSAGANKDARGFEGYIQASQKLSDTLKANAGIGYVTDKRDGDKHADNKMLVFVNAPITLAKNVTLTPEISYYDEMKAQSGASQPKSYAIGAQWRIDF
jgi:hypothetical protein